MSERYVSARGVREFVAQVCRDFGIARPPDVVIVESGRHLERLCGGGVACFEAANGAGVIYLGRDLLSDPVEGLGAVLHEVYHYMQLAREGEEFYARTLRERRMRHCERPSEREAKAFESVYLDFYRKKWERMAYVRL